MASNVKASKYHGKAMMKGGVNTLSTGNLHTAQRNMSPPALFGGTGIETAMIDDLKVKMRDFNSELHHEMSMNQKLASQCKSYTDKLASINSQYESYKIKTDAKLDMLDDKLMTAKQQLREEKNAV